VSATTTLAHRGLTVRPIKADDAVRLVAFHEALDDESHYFRFFNAHPHLTPYEVEHFTHVDHLQREAVLVLDDGRIVAVGRYDELHDDPTTAEVAFVVALDHRREGIATSLLHELARRAQAVGFDTFLGVTLSINTRMRDVFREAGYPLSTTFDVGVIETRMDIRDA
jgi:GNAT superfamily N-acetyltransferase